MPEQKQQSAIRITGQGTAAVAKVPVPEIRPGQVLVRTVAVAHNPSDWMVLDWSPNIGATNGCDYAGVVVEVGDDVAALFSAGDRVAGFAHGGNSENHHDGAFAEYIAADPYLAARIPDSLSFEEAAPLGLGIVTAAQYLYQALGLPLPALDRSPGEKEADGGRGAPFNLLVYGGSTATGMLAIQLAKLSGATVLATCSARSAPFVESLGADAVFDYSDPDCVSKIKSHVWDSDVGRLTLILDCIGDDVAAKFCTRCFVPPPGNEKCIYASLLYPTLPKEERDFEVEQKFMLAYTAFGHGFTMSGREYPPSEENKEFMRGFFREYVGRLWEGGKVRLMPVEVRNGGLEDVVGGIEEVRGGGGRGRKIVWKVG